MSRLAADVSMLLTQTLDIRDAVICDEVPLGLAREYGKALWHTPRPDSFPGQGRADTGAQESAL